ncbi:MAG TPA: hypothetical protein PK878_02500 [bacterium]|nr:hypothetical protein [bacterium]
MTRLSSQHWVYPCSRRTFIWGTLGALSAPYLKPCPGASAPGPGREIPLNGPGARYTPQLHAAFVRRKENYGMWWPGEIYDGGTARVNYTQEIEQAAREIGVHAEILSQPLFSLEETQNWLESARKAQSDGLLLVLLDRQQHAWPSVSRALDTKIPVVAFSPVGSSFTTNTAPLAKREGIFIASTDDFSQAAYGMRMLATRAKLREMRFVVIAGKERRDTQLPFFGTRLRYIPAQAFLDEYNQIPASDEARRIVTEYLQQATAVHGPTEEDVMNGVKSYFAARAILDREEGDGITMDCLGALGQTQVSLPCISWSRMLDQGIPAACEADLGACVSHALVQYLFGRPGFQQDPVAETSRGGLIGAHCTCPTRLRGFDHPPEPFRISHHHGKRDAVPVPRWETGHPMTVLDVLLDPPDKPPRMIVSSGKVLDNISVPPAGGCVVSVLARLDGVEDTLDYPGFHQVFFYGNFKKELCAYGRLTGLEVHVV